MYVQYIVLYSTVYVQQSTLLQCTYDPALIIKSSHPNIYTIINAGLRINVILYTIGLHRILMGRICCWLLDIYLFFAYNKNETNTCKKNSRKYLLFFKWNSRKLTYHWVKLPGVLHIIESNSLLSCISLSQTPRCPAYHWVRLPSVLHITESDSPVSCISLSQTRILQCPSYRWVYILRWLVYRYPLMQCHVTLHCEIFK